MYCILFVISFYDKVNIVIYNINKRVSKNENYFVYVFVLEFYLLKGKNRFVKFIVNLK